MYRFFYYAMMLCYGGLVIETVFLSRDHYRNVNLQPFDMIHAQGTLHINVWGNVLLFIPLGIYLMLHYKQVALWGVMLASLCIEIFQYIFARGASDIDDFLLNTMGGLIGMGLAWILGKCFADVQKAVAMVSMIIGLPFIGLTLLLFIAN